MNKPNHMPMELHIRKKRPKLGIETDYNNSRKAAIHMFCMICMGGSISEVQECKSQLCPLYQYRPYAKKGVKDSRIPTKQQYLDELKQEIDPKKQAWGKILGSLKKKEE